MPLTKLKANDVRQNWRDTDLQAIMEREAETGRKDMCARRTSFHQYCDYLHKEGMISDYLVEIIAYPKECEGY